jgi:hypothetical protein
MHQDAAPSVSILKEKNAWGANGKSYKSISPCQNPIQMCPDHQIKEKTAVSVGQLGTSLNPDTTIQIDRGAAIDSCTPHATPASWAEDQRTLSRLELLPLIVVAALARQAAGIRGDFFAPRN